MNSLEVPLFPLNTVLFPESTLELRLFEPRYLDMISYCMKTASSFVVVAIKEGPEAGAPASFYDVGCYAHIVDFDQLDDGLLGISCRGGDRVAIASSRTQTDGLNMGLVSALPFDPDVQPDTDYVALVQLLQAAFEREELSDFTASHQPRWDSASWICARLSELLPLPLEARQALLELNDPQQQMDVLYAILQEQDCL